MRAGAGCIPTRANQSCNREQPLYIIVQRFRSGLVFKAHRLLCLSTPGFRVIKKMKKVRDALPPVRIGPGSGIRIHWKEVGRCRAGMQRIETIERHLTWKWNIHVRIPDISCLFVPFFTLQQRSRGCGVHLMHSHPCESGLRWDV